MFLLDTDVVSRTSPFSKPSVDSYAWLREHWTKSFVSVVTISELWFGARRLDNKGASRKCERLSAWIDEVERSMSERLLGVDLAIGRRTGMMLARAEANGHKPSFVDACLAATAVAAQLTVVTFNERHFSAFEVAHQRPILAAEDP